MLWFTGTTAITQKIRYKSQNNFYQVRKNMLLMELQQTSIDESEFQDSTEATHKGLSLAYQSLKD